MAEIEKTIADKDLRGFWRNKYPSYHFAEYFKKVFMKD